MTLRRPCAKTYDVAGKSNPSVQSKILKGGWSTENRYFWIKIGHQPEDMSSNDYPRVMENWK